MIATCCHSSEGWNDRYGVTVSSDRVYVADDDSHRIFSMDRRTGRIMDGIPTLPFPESAMEAPGPEGLDITEKGALLLADDDGRSLYHLSLDSGKFGEIIQHQDTTSIGAVEGAEKMGERTLLAAGGTKIFSVDSDMQILGDPVKISAEGFGRHIAGVGADEAEERVFITLSAYVKNQNWRNHQSGFMEMDAELREIRGFWHLGPFSNDPRDIAVLDNLVYVADGRSDFKDKDTVEMNRGGQKIFVFLLENDPDALEKALPFLPVRRLN